MSAMPEAIAMMPKEIGEAINAIMSSVDYIQKKGENSFHNYKFAAVGDVLAKIQPAMAAQGLIIVQHEIRHALVANDSVMTASYQFILCHKSGATWDAAAVHTGMATARNTKGGFDDKALNKCHTAARKYFLLSLFQIPTGDMADADGDEDRGDNGKKDKNPPKPSPAAKPAVAESRPRTVNEFISGAKSALLDCKTKEQVSAWMKIEANKEDLQKLEEKHPEKFEMLSNFINNRYDELASKQNAL